MVTLEEKAKTSQKIGVVIFWGSWISKANFIKSAHKKSIESSSKGYNHWYWTLEPVLPFKGMETDCLTVPITCCSRLKIMDCRFFISPHITVFCSVGCTPLNCIACLLRECEWSCTGQRWVADCIVKQPAGWRVSWQEESGLALSCLAYNWPGEDVKWNLSRARVMEEKTSHVFIKEEMREGCQRERDRGCWYNEILEKNKFALQYLL